MTQANAMLCALAAFFAWCLTDVAVKLAAQSVFSPFAIIGILGLIACAALLMSAAWQRDFAGLKPRHPLRHLIVGVCWVIPWYANVIAFRHLPLIVFYPIVFMAPLLIATLSVALKHEVMTARKLACLMAGFAGVVITVASRGGGTGEWIGYAACFSNVAAFAVYTIVIRKLSATDTVASIQLSSSLALILAALAGMALSPQQIPVTAAPFVFALAAGLFNLAAGFFYNKALQYTASTNVAQMHYTQIIFGALLGYLIWHEIPDWNLAAGAALIIGAGIAVARQVRRADMPLAEVK